MTGSKGRWHAVAFFLVFPNGLFRIAKQAVWGCDMGRFGLRNGLFRKCMVAGGRFVARMAGSVGLKGGG